MDVINNLPIVIQWLILIVGIPIGVIFVGACFFNTAGGEIDNDFSLNWAIARTNSERRAVILEICLKAIRTWFIVGLVSLLAIGLIGLPVFVLLRLGVRLEWAGPIGVILGIILMFGGVALALHLQEHKGRREARRQIANLQRFGSAGETPFIIQTPERK